MKRPIFWAFLLFLQNGKERKKWQSGNECFNVARNTWLQGQGKEAGVWCSSVLAAAPVFAEAAASALSV